jgi:hypothetical protein
VVSLVLVVLVIFFLWEARDWQIRARLAPWTIGFAVLAIALVQVFAAGRALIRQPSPSGDRTARRSATVGAEVALGGGDSAVLPADDAIVRRRAIFIIAWIVGFGLGLWLLGFRLGAPLLTFSFLRFGAGESARAAILFALGTYLIIVVLFHGVVALPFPPGQLVHAVGFNHPTSTPSML